MRKIYPANFKGSAFKSKISKWLLGLFVVLLGMAPSMISAQTISVTNVTTTPVCSGLDVTITFDVTNGIGLGTYFTNSTIYPKYI